MILFRWNFFNSHWSPFGWNIKQWQFHFSFSVKSILNIKLSESVDKPGNVSVLDLPGDVLIVPQVGRKKNHFQNVKRKNSNNQASKCSFWFVTKLYWRTLFYRCSLKGLVFKIMRIVKLLCFHHGTLESLEKINITKWVSRTCDWNFLLGVSLQMQ